MSFKKWKRFIDTFLSGAAAGIPSALLEQYKLNRAEEVRNRERERGVSRFLRMASFFLLFFADFETMCR